MGLINNLLYNDKRLCPICGCSVPGFFATKTEGVSICKQCKEKIDLPKDDLEKMTVKDFQEYLNFYEDNRSLRTAFRENARFECT